MNETPVIKRAKARATRTQLLTDQTGIQNRLRKMPEAIAKAEKDVCYAQRALTDAEQLRMEKRKVRTDAVATLEALRKEKAEGDVELAQIEVELDKITVLV